MTRVSAISRSISWKIACSGVTLPWIRDGDGHYDVLSALQKSIRGSDVDASLHYAARLIEAGDLPSLARRLTVIAYEDIGLANPEAQIHTVTALDVAQRIGFQKPAFSLLMSSLIWLFLPNPTQPMWRWTRLWLISKHRGICLSLGTCVMVITVEVRELGNAQNYLYPHNYPGNWVKQDYLPEKSKTSTTSLRKILASTNGLWLKERKLSTVCENLKSFSKIALSS